MKKTKLLALPILSIPVISMLPIVSCNRNGDVNVSSEFTKYVDVESITEKLVVGESYIITFSVKEDQIGKQYLPNTLTKVKSGDKELYQGSITSNSLSDYYNYYVYDNNTKAILTIYIATGSISIDANTSTLKSVTATGIDLTGRTIAEFEVDETLNNDTSRVLATAVLENGDKFTLTSNYEIALDNFELGYKFLSTDINREGTGTVKYNGVTSSTFNYKIHAKTVAWMKHTLIDTKIEKYPSIEAAIDVYNNESAWGTYTIYLASDKYSFEGDAPLTIKQSAGKYLTIEAEHDPYYEGAEMVYSVEFDHVYTATGQSLIKIESDEDASLSSIDIRGIKFNAPTTTQTITSPVVYDILLDSGTTAPHDVTIKHCKFVGNSADATIVNAIGTTTASTPTAAPTNIYIGSCIGQYLNQLYDGYVGHDATSQSYDLTMYYVLLEDSRQLCNIYGSELVNCFRDVSAYVMYEPTAEKTTIDSGMVINGTGTYDMTKCKFTQLTPLDSSVTMASFIKANKLGGATGNTKQFNLYDAHFNKSELETGNALHSIWNASGTTYYDWLLSIAGIQTATIYGDATKGSIYWDAE